MHLVVECPFCNETISVLAETDQVGNRVAGDNQLVVEFMLPVGWKLVVDEGVLIAICGDSFCCDMAGIALLN